MTERSYKKELFIFFFRRACYGVTEVQKMKPLNLKENPIFSVTNSVTNRVTGITSVTTVTNATRREGGQH